jgi:hypothetical protein
MSVDDPLWEENSRVVRLIGDRLVAAGWATRVVTHGGGMSIEWTDAGRVKYSMFRGLLTELGYFEFTREDHVALFAFLRLFE